MASLTEKELAKATRDAKAGGGDVWLTDATKQRGVGALRFRARPNGPCAIYFRYTNVDGKQDQLALGVYAPDGAAGMTLKQARAKYGELSKLYQAGRRDLRAYVEHQHAEERAQIEAAARARDEAVRQAKSGTLKALLNGYVAHLERQGKQSAQDVRNIFERNVMQEWPHLAAMRASEITHRDISAMLAKLIERGAGRTAGKLRSYLRAAYAGALQAESDPTIHPDMHGFNLTANPAAIVPAKTLARYNRARERNLNVSEMHHFLKALDSESGTAPDAVRLSLYLGGQRIAQLLRTKPADADIDSRTITLYDRKGARTQPRAHVLPLTDRAHEIVDRYASRVVDDEPAKFLFTSHNKVSVRSETVSEVITEISNVMVKAKTARAPFQLRDIRRTCETMMAAMGISREVRAQTQSHGLGGVQQRHYDKHEYMDEKRAALQAWDSRLREIAEGKPKQNVVPMRKSKA